MVVGSFLILAGLVLVASGLWSYRSAHQFVQTAHSAPGTVVELVRSSYKDRDRDRGFGEKEPSHTWCPVITFTDHHGAVNEFQLDLCTNPPSYQRGEQVTVLYAENSPHQAKLKDQSMYVTAYILLGMSALFAVIGICWFFTGFFAKKWLSRRYRTAIAVT